MAKLEQKDEEISSEILSQITDILFENLSRYIDSQSLKQASVEKERNAEPAMYKSVTPIAEDDYDDSAELTQEQALYANKYGLNSRSLQSATESYKRKLKLALVIQKIDEANESPDPGSDLYKAIAALPHPSKLSEQQLLVSENIKLIKKRNFRAISYIEKQPWASLGLVEPELSVETLAKVSGLPEDEVIKLQQILKSQNEETKAEPDTAHLEESKDSKPATV